MNRRDDVDAFEFVPLTYDAFEVALKIPDEDHQLLEMVAIDQPAVVEALHVVATLRPMNTEFAVVVGNVDGAVIVGEFVEEVAAEVGLEVWQIGAAVDVDFGWI